MYCSLNSLQGGLLGDYIGFRLEVWGLGSGLGSKLLQGGYIGDYTGDHYMGLLRGILGL